MSLILEALRKSEAERRRGKAPDLRIELQPPPATGRRARASWSWIAGGTLLAAALLATVWWQGRGGPGGDAAGAVAEPSIGKDSASAAAPARVPQPEASTAGVERDGAGANGLPPIDRILPPEPPAPRLAAPGPRPDAPAPGSSKDRQAPVASTPPVSTGSPTQPVPAEDAPAPAPPAAPPQGAADDTAAIRITSLPASQRQRLPAMKLSLHMWNADPARRFVVVDGQRRGEGDRLGEAVITAIDRDGLLLDLDGQAVRVPLP